MAIGRFRMRADVRRVVVLATAASLTVLTLAAVPASSSAASRSSSCTGQSAPSRAGKFGGIAHPIGNGSGCNSTKTEAPYQGSPPLLDHHGPVMAVPAVGSTLVVTPIYWAPSGYSFSASYQSVINTYLAGLAADSGKTTNVFSTNTQYPGTNGSISYNIATAPAIVDNTAFPSAGCTVNSGPVYSDGTGYSTCLDDAQLTTEIGSVVASHGFAHDFGHIYPLFTPKGVESCFYAGNPSNQACSINPTSSTAFCAYHSYSGSTGAPTVYANMPFPIYQSATNYSCTAEGLGGGIQSPNGDTDADVEVSPLSHEMSEAITDPELNAWYDISGNENGDDCAYIYGALSGTPGAYYNQVVGGGHYLTQEEFSNADYVPSVSGCVQHSTSAATPAVTSVAPRSGSTAGGATVTITGTGLSGATAVKFGTRAATSFSVGSDTSITAVAPAHSAGVVHVRVTTSAGQSPAVAGDRYTYGAAAPAVSGVSPSGGPTAGGTTVTITGTGFTGATAVKFGTTAATSFTVVSATKISAVSPAHAAGLQNVRVTTSGGTSAIVSGDQYRYQDAPGITSVAPGSGSTAGGQTVTIVGANFTAASAVKFGTTAAAFTVVSSTKITATSPAHASGLVNVRVTTASGTSAVVTGDRYTYS